MINEKKVRLMTKAAIIEENNRKKLFVSGKFYNSDFVFFQTLKAVIGITVVFMILLGFILIDSMDEFTTQHSVSDLSAYVSAVLFVYIGTIVVTVIISIISCTEKYYKAKELKKEYNSILKRLDKGYSGADRQKRADKDE